jgi:hypothetical protein
MLLLAALMLLAVLLEENPESDRLLSVRLRVRAGGGKLVAAMAAAPAAAGLGGRERGCERERELGAPSEGISRAACSWYMGFWWC